MKIGYKEILDLYDPEYDLFICHSLRPAFGVVIDTDEFLKIIGIDVYGPIVGRFWYYLALAKFVTLSGARMTLEDVYPSVRYEIIGLPDVCTRREYRIAVLTHLAKQHPERKFDVQYFL